MSATRWNDSRNDEAAVTVELHSDKTQCQHLHYTRTTCGCKQQQQPHNQELTTEPAVYITNPKLNTNTYLTSKNLVIGLPHSVLSSVSFIYRLSSEDKDE